MRSIRFSLALSGFGTIFNADDGETGTVSLGVTLDIVPKPDRASENLIERITGFFGKTSKGEDSPSSGVDS
jgi:hypothetical protein